MSIDDAIPMGPVKDKLRNLREYLPGQIDEIYELGIYLADRLNDEIVPEGFNMAVELLFYDLQTGIDGFTGKPMSSHLAGQPFILYAILRSQIPYIARAVCPEDFANGVERVQARVRDML
nr:hypothetical protein [Nanoarchaeum sp.]